MNLVIWDVVVSIVVSGRCNLEVSLFTLSRDYALISLFQEQIS